MTSLLEALEIKGGGGKREGGCEIRAQREERRGNNSMCMQRTTMLDKKPRKRKHKLASVCVLRLIQSEDEGAVRVHLYNVSTLVFPSLSG